MHKYALLLTGSRSTEARRIEFEAADSSAALELAEREGGDRSMELWENGRLLGTIRPMGGFWRLSHD
jgi:hypothetical protein